MITPTQAPPDPTSTPVSSWRRVSVASGRTLWHAGLPVLIALIVGGIVLAATGNNPFEIYSRLISEAFGNASRINATLAAATPILFTALAAAFAYRAGVFTVGVEGSFVAGGLVGAVVGAQMGGIPPLVAITVPLVCASIAGTLVAVIPGLLRALWNVDEVVTTLMFNFVVAGIAAWSVQSFFQARGQANSATAYVADTAVLPALVPPGQTNVGLIIALTLLLAYALWMRYTVIGFEFRAVGTAPRFAAAQGLRMRMVILVALLGAGLIGGLGGGSHALGIIGRYTAGFSAGFGFTGIAIALLARFNPIGILVGSILFGALNAAGTTLQLFIDLPVQIIDVLEGTVMVFAVAVIVIPRFLRSRTGMRTGGVS